MFNYSQIEFLSATVEIESLHQDLVSLGVETDIEVAALEGLDNIKETLKRWWEKAVAFLNGLWEKMKSWFKKADDHDATTIAAAAKTDLEAAKKAAEEKGDTGLVNEIVAKIKKVDEFLAFTDRGADAIKKANDLAEEAGKSISKFGSDVANSVGKFLQFKLNLASPAGQLTACSNGLQDMLKQSDALINFVNTHVKPRIDEKMMMVGLMNKMASGATLESVIGSINRNIPQEGVKLEFGLRAITFDSTNGYPKYVYGQSSRKAESNTKIKGVTHKSKTDASRNTERKIEQIVALETQVDKLKVEVSKIPGDKLGDIKTAVSSFRSSGKADPIVLKKLSIFENALSAFTDENKLLGFLRNELSSLVTAFNKLPLKDADLKQNQAGSSPTPPSSNA